MEQRRCFGCMGLTDQPVCPRCGWGAGQDNEPHQLPVGAVLAEKYLVGRVLGQGGFGITYVGWDLNLDIRVCIKEFYPSSTVNRDHRFTRCVNCNTTGMETGYAASRERFLREAKSLAKFRGERQIVSIFDFFQAIVIGIKRSLGLIEILIVLGFLPPRQIHQPIHIGLDNTGFTTGHR